MGIDRSALMYKLAAVDLDDTLLGPDGTVSPRNAAAVRALSASGVMVVLASGRMHQDTAKYCPTLGLTGPVISYNGAMVRSADGSATYHHVPVLADLASQIVHWAQARGYSVNYYLDDTLYVRQRTPWTDLYTSRTSSVAHEVGDLTQFDGREPTKLIILESPEETDRLLAEFRSRYASSLYITKTKPEYLEFMNRGVSKGKALEALSGRLGIPSAEMVAFGDSYNDVSMLQYAGVGVAMGDGVEEARAAADYVAPPCLEDGFAAAVRHLFGLDI
jgi:Cof subfamily protein (haloacid dehalogenase superfamily)